MAWALTIFLGAQSCPRPRHRRSFRRSAWAGRPSPGVVTAHARQTGRGKHFPLELERLDTLGAMREAALTRFDWNIVTARLEKFYLDVTARVHAA